jgi:hypothetical protein
MATAGEAEDLVELRQVARITPADVVIIAPLNSEDLRGICRQLLDEYSQSKIVTLSDKKTGACIYVTNVARQPIDESLEPDSRSQGTSTISTEVPLINRPE